jgi:HEXXH motif-containing protein
VEAPADLTIPDAGSTTLRRVFGRALKRTLATAMRLPLGRFETGASDDYLQLRAALRSLLDSRDSTGAVFAVFRRPTVSTLVRCIERELHGQGDVDRLDAWLVELTATIGCELAAAGALPPAGLRFKRCPPRILCLGARRAVHVDRPGPLILSARAASFGPASHAALPFEAPAPSPGEMLQAAPGVHVSCPFYEIGDDLALCLEDNNPLSSVEAHPDKLGNAIDLGDRSPADWVESLRAARARVEEHLPVLAEEMRLLLQALVPVGASNERHLSASYAEAIGMAYLSWHPDPMTMTEALIHEFSHNKLNALLGLDPLLENAHSMGHVSPVRPDLRPLLGVLLAAHAFIPVAHLYERMLAVDDPLSRRQDFVMRYRQIVTSNHEAVATLGRLGRFTPTGAPLLDELVRWDEHFAPVRYEAAR